MTELVLDTSVAVPLLVTSHVAHRSVSAALGDRAAALAVTPSTRRTRSSPGCRATHASPRRTRSGCCGSGSSRRRSSTAGPSVPRQPSSLPQVSLAAPPTTGWSPSLRGRRASRSPPGTDVRRAPTGSWTWRSSCSSETGRSAPQLEELRPLVDARSLSSTVAHGPDLRRNRRRWVGDGDRCLPRGRRGAWAEVRSRCDQYPCEMQAQC